MMKKSSVKFSSENTFSKTPVSSKNSDSFSPENFDFENRTNAGRTPSAKQLLAGKNTQLFKENLNLDMSAPKLLYQTASGVKQDKDSLFRLRNNSPQVVPLGDLSNLNFSPRPMDSNVKSPTRGRASNKTNFLSQPSPIPTSQSIANESAITGQAGLFSPTNSVANFPPSIREAEAIVSPDNEGMWNFTDITLQKTMVL